MFIVKQLGKGPNIYFEYILTHYGDIKNNQPKAGKRLGGEAENLE